MALSSRRYARDLFLALCVLVVDRIVKYSALSALVPAVPIKVGSFLGIDLSWTLTFNTGAAWGAFEEEPRSLFFFRIVFLALLLAVYGTAQLKSLSRAALAIIIAGAIGNVVDTIEWGHVVDMIHLQFWGWDYPVFNIADSAICVGGIMMLSSALFTPEEGKGGML